MKYAIITFTNSPKVIDDLPVDGNNIKAILGQGIINSGVFSDREQYDRETSFYYYSMNSWQAQKAGVVRDPTIGIGYIGADRKIKLAYLYDENNISESRISQAMKELDSTLVSSGGGWVPGPGYQGGFPGGMTGVVSLENVGDAFAKIINFLILAGIVYFAYETRNA